MSNHILEQIKSAFEAEDLNVNSGSDYEDFCSTDSGVMMKASIEEFSGGEGQGDTISCVLRVTIDNVEHYIETVGSYSSWDGSDWSYAEASIVYPNYYIGRSWVDRKPAQSPWTLTALADGSFRTNDGSIVNAKAALEVAIAAQLLKVVPDFNQRELRADQLKDI